jgi:hypothetical protein
MSQEWFYVSNGQSVGPVSFGELQQLAGFGKIGAQDQVCVAGGSWQPASQVAGLISPAGGTATAAAELGYHGRRTGTATVTERAVELLRATGPYARIMSVLSFIGAGFMVLGAIGMLIATSAAPRGTLSAGTPAILSLVYFVLAFLYIPPGIFLWKYASHCKMFGITRDEHNLEQGLQAQKSFWKYAAIATLVCIGLYIGGIATFVILSIARP